MNLKLERKIFIESELSGLSNLMNIEMHNWFRTKKICFHSTLWFLLLFGLVVVASLNQYTAKSALDMYLNFYGIFGAIGIILSVNGAIIGERKSGITNWLLSKPISRPAYIISKFLGNLLGFFISMILIPVTLNILYISFRSEPMLYFNRIFILIGCMIIYLSFYLSLTIMMGALLKNRGLAAGIPLGIFLTQSLLSSIIPNIAMYFPISMFSGDDEMSSMLGIFFFTGNFYLFKSIMTSVFFSLCFLLISIWRFKKEEI